MNLLHRWVCSSSRWKTLLGEHILPWAVEGLELGPNVLEIGRLWRCRGAASQPRRPLDLRGNRRRACGEASSPDSGPELTVVCESATEMSFPDSAFDGVVCFTMLHHVPSAKLQDQLLAEVARTLRPGGIFAGTDSRYSRFFGLMHLFDTMVVV